ncbi:MAG: DUF1343 domain-containing protein [Clostridia bacterium]|nr:DUF1343 domain-containing protein [Clostridia bacterium]
MKTKHKVLCGIDSAAVHGIRTTGKCGLITAPTGVTRDLIPTAEILTELCDLRALFGPEHGIRGDAQAGAAVADFITDERTGLPAYSLYGKGQASAEKALAELDTVIFDIQDVGARFYTYAYTMTDAMKFCAERGIRFIVLDRPNPIGGMCAEGSILDRKFSSFVGRFPTPTRSGLTIGEFAMMMNATEGIGCDLDVIPCEGWTRDMYYDDTDLVFIQPSPNIPTTDTAFAYIGTCIFEGTNLSEGRGTTRPFEIIGAPWLNPAAVIETVGRQQGVILRETAFTPTFSKYAGEPCRSIQLHVTDRDAFSPFAAGLRLLDAIRKNHSQFELRPFIAKLLGSDAVFADDFDTEAFISSEAEKVALWQEKSSEWMIYQAGNK